MNKLEGKNYKWPGNYQTCIVPYFVYDYCSYGLVSYMVKLQYNISFEIKINRYLKL